MNKRWRLASLVLLALFALAAAGLFSRRQPTVQSRLVAAAAQNNLAGFARAQGPWNWNFPADFGPHLDFQTEWWYYTGNLESSEGRHFGFQLTFFRRGLLPPADQPMRHSDWAADQVYMAHFALTDVAAGHFQAFERLSRGAAGLAGAQSQPYRVWLEDWEVNQIQPGIYRLQAAQDNLAVDLTLTGRQGPVLQGYQGYSPKGAGAGQASYYYSQTYLLTQGSLRTSQGNFSVNGLSWMDHEFSTSALTNDQVGWDWFALQLENGSQVMVFQIRQADGSIDPYSSGTFIVADGQITHLSQQDFQIQVLDTWKSPHSSAVYPSKWTLSLPSTGLTLEIEPYLADQELNLSYSYWEGAVRVSGKQNGQAIQGNGYIEMTGYAGSIGGQF